MNDQPSAIELLTAVKSFVQDVAAPQLTGHAAFHARVATNALDTVIRELTLRPDAEQAETERLRNLLGEMSEGQDLTAALADKIRSGEMTLSTPGLFEHLKQTSIDQLLIDQPRYSGLKPHVE